MTAVEKKLKIYTRYNERKPIEMEFEIGIWIETKEKKTEFRISIRFMCAQAQHNNISLTIHETIIK